MPNNNKLDKDAKDGRKSAHPKIIASGFFANTHNNQNTSQADKDEEIGKKRILTQAEYERERFERFDMPEVWKGIDLLN